MDDKGGVREIRDDEFERLYDKHAQDLFAFLRYRTGNTAVAEDLLADTFERALRARRRFDPRKARSKTWLYAIALNCLTDNTRRTAGERRALQRVAAGAGAELASGPEDLDGLLEREHEGVVGQDLDGSLAVLGEREREAISLRYGAELTVAEIARLTGEPPTTIESRVSRALDKLREAMA
jgi:RNA polymerase sigma-70 factor (ECF subfamily)